MKELQVITNALDAAVKAGVFNLQDTGTILQSINTIGSKLQQFETMSTPQKTEEVLKAPAPKGKK